MTPDTFFFICAAACFFGQFMDARTTDKALAAGDTEANPIVALFGKLGVTGIYIFKCVGIGMGWPLLGWALAKDEVVGGYVGLGMAAAGIGAAIYNAITMVKAKQAKSFWSAISPF